MKRQEKRLEQIDIAKVVQSKNNPRKSFSEEGLKELAESIKEVGIIEPITVRELPKGRYEIVCGERRYRAAKIALMTEIPAIIRKLDDKQAMDFSLIENLQRKDVSPMEEAHFIKLLLEQNKEDFASLAIRLGKSEAFVRARFQLNELIDEMQLLIDNNEIKIGVGVLISSYDKETQQNIYENFFRDDEDSYSSWRRITQKDIENRLKNRYNVSLECAVFDTTPCLECSFNSMAKDLFVLEENSLAQCLNSKCYQEKTRTAKINTVLTFIEDNPSLPILAPFSSQEWIVEVLKEQGHDVEEGNFKHYPKMPQDDNNDELEKYHDTINEIYKDRDSGKYEDCILIGYNEALKIVYRDTEVLREVSNAEVIKIKERKERQSGIKVENTIKEIKENVLNRDVKIEAKELTDLETNIIYSFMFFALSSTNRVILFGEDDRFLSNETKYQKAKELTKEEKDIVLRDFMLYELKQSASSENNIYSDLLIDVASLHFPDETKSIVDKYQEIEKKRVKALEKKLEDVLETTK